MTTTPVPGAGAPADRLIVAELAGLLNEAECFGFVSEEEEVAYLARKAQLLHRLVDALGDETSRYIAQDADDRAARARAVAETTFEDLLAELAPRRRGRRPGTGTGAGRSSSR